MPSIDASDRMYQSFLRGYLDSASGSGAPCPPDGGLPYTTLIQAASVESKELRRSIDACRHALEQLQSLPQAEQDQLKIEARSSLQALQTATVAWLSRLVALRPADATASVTAGAARPLTTRSRKNRPRR